MKMFTKEKLEKWIDLLGKIDKSYITMIPKITTLILDPFDNVFEYDGEENWKSLQDLKHTLEQIYTSITSDNSI